MILLVIGIIYVFLSFCYRKNYNSYLGLLVILIVMGFQAGVSGDYDRYEATFNMIQFEGPIVSLRSERGWIWLNNLFTGLGSFQLLVFAISFIEYLILVSFIKNYTNSRFKFIAGLIFYFSINMMLFQMKALRQGLAIELCLAALMCIDKIKSIKGVILSFLLVTCACTFHTSALIMTPFVIAYIYLKNKYILSQVKTKRNILFPIFITSLYIILFIGKSVFIDYIKPILLGLSLMEYEGYFGEMQDVNYNILITLYGIIVVFITSYCVPYFTG